MSRRVVFACTSLILSLTLGALGCDGGGGTTAAGSEVEIPIPLEIAFSAGPTSGTVPMHVQFTNESFVRDATEISYVWLFGDDEISEEVNPVHLYRFPGTFTVSLWALTDIGTFRKDKIDLIEVAPFGPTPVVDFTATPRETSIGPMVQFTNLTDLGGSPDVRYHWIFGDGHESNEVHPTHAYSAAGKYTITLDVLSTGGPGSSTKPEFIQVFDAPDAGFQATPTEGGAPLDVQFADLSDLKGAPGATYFWNFGDGQTGTERNPLHRYSTPGFYSVALTVTTIGGSDSVQRRDLIRLFPLPIADFVGSPRSGPAPLDVSFLNLSDLRGAPDATYEWTFGDGQTSNERSPSHTYRFPGSFDVSLRVSTIGGFDIETKTEYVVASGEPTADFIGTPSSGVAPLLVQFRDLSNLNNAETAEYLWNFGDDETSTDKDPLHVYSAEGEYTVTLEVTTEAGSDIETKLDYIQVGGEPTAAFTAFPTIGSAPLTVSFTDMSDLNGASSATYAWDFGDGFSSTTQHPSHNYAIAGSYDVTLTVTTIGGMDTEFKGGLITVLPPVVVPGSKYIFTYSEGLKAPIFDIELTLHVSSEVFSSGTVFSPGLGFNQPFVVVPGVVTDVTIPTEAMVKGSDVTRNAGLAIAADAPISIYGIHDGQATGDGFAGYPIDALGTEYFVMSYSSIDGTLIGMDSEFAIVANENNTTVTITPSASTGTRTAGVPYVVVLDELDVYQLQADDDEEDLTGTHILSDKPIAVFSGNVCAKVPIDTGGCDHLTEQLPPVSAWNNTVLTVPFASSLAGGDQIRVMAAQDGTTVTMDFIGVEPIMLNRGEYAEVTVEDPNLILADGPILVSQYLRGGEESGSGETDPSMTINLSPDKFLSTYTFTSHEGGSFISHFVNIIASTPDADAGAVILDGAPIAPGAFTAVPDVGFSFVRLPVAPGSHTLTAPNPVGLHIYGFGGKTSYSFTGGMSF